MVKHPMLALNEIDAALAKKENCMAFKYENLDKIQHLERGSTYVIIKTPYKFRVRDGESWKPAYAYMNVDTREEFARPADVIEDESRYQLAEKAPVF